MIGGTLDRLHLGDLMQWLQMGGLSGRLTRLAETSVSRVLLAPSLDFSFDPEYPVHALLHLDLDVGAADDFHKAAEAARELLE